MSGTEIRKKSKYDSDEMPSRNDREKAQELFYQDGKPDPIAMADELALQKRKTYENKTDYDKLHTKVDKLTVMTKGFEKELLEQGVEQTKMISRQGNISDTVNEIRGMGKLAMVLVPIMMTAIGLILAFK